MARMGNKFNLDSKVNKYREYGDNMEKTVFGTDINKEVTKKSFLERALTFEGALVAVFILIVLFLTFWSIIY